MSNKYNSFSDIKINKQFYHVFLMLNKNEIIHFNTKDINHPTLYSYVIVGDITVEYGNY